MHKLFIACAYAPSDIFLSLVGSGLNPEDGLTEGE
jgi:hypothetical protein